MNFTAVALGNNKHDVSPDACLKKQNEVCREGTGVLPTNTGGNWSKSRF